MEITAGPAPGIKEILRFPSRSIDLGSLPWSDGKEKSGLHFYHRGMYALRDGVGVLLKKRGRSEGLILLPGYFCDEALLPLRETGSRLAFYPVRRDMTPDWEKTEAMLGSLPAPDVFVLVHYFGFPNRTGEAREFCGRHDIELLEDAAHMLLPTAAAGSGNISVYSPRKLLPLPEGGLLRIPGENSGNVCDLPSADIAYSLKWIARSLMKAAVVKLGIPWHGMKNISRSVRGGGGLQGNEPWSAGRCAPYTLSLLYAMKDNIQSVVERRRENYACLARLLKGLSGIDMVFPSLTEDVCPFALPVLLERGQKAVIERLNTDYRVPASDWPDLPPEVTGQEQDHKDALWLREHILLLPVHQGLTENEMNYIASSLKSVLSRESKGF